jgi:hypothetical protein
MKLKHFFKVMFSGIHPANSGWTVKGQKMVRYYQHKIYKGEICKTGY